MRQCLSKVLPPAKSQTNTQNLKRKLFAESELKIIKLEGGAANSIVSNGDEEHGNNPDLLSQIKSGRTKK